MARTWFITGVSAGLGRALALAALEAGDIVAGTVRKSADRDAFASLGPKAHGFVADVTDEAAVAAAVAAAEALSGGIDILVNNAGYGLTGAVEETSLDEARAQFEANVFGPLTVLRSALPRMRSRRSGHVINITSVSGLAAWSGTGVYCASKFALEGLGEALAQEVAPLGIKVTNVAPGGMRTDYAGRSLARTAQLIDDYEGTAHMAPKLLAQHAGQESGDPARAAQAILKIAGADDAPLRLLLGADALHYAMRKMGQMTTEIGDWAGLSTSISFPET
ncbi:oxidoreductase [Phenylobacterium sp.]|uniref:oxidoreductase n=1 Tax=Phenylobacterium sp. TaxID=1871053 RepID=UPI002730D83E|nr:oxidoreductase [Phenylobacterium sp.]MDP2215556.1 oxidoreductase [Phenylobacterium sp.]